MSKEAAEETIALAKKEGFARWMAEPMTRAMISTIPAGDNPDILRALLEAAYHSGVGTGCVVTTLHLMEKLMKPRP